jgi:hypothetical protein
MSFNTTAAGRVEPMPVDSMERTGGETWVDMVPADSGRDFIDLSEWFDMYGQAHAAAQFDEMTRLLTVRG